MFVFYREVFKAKHRTTGKKVALKKVLMENEKEGVRDLRGAGVRKEMMMMMSVC